MPRRNNRKPAILAALNKGSDPIRVAAEFGTTQSYVYRLDKQRRLASRGIPDNYAEKEVRTPIGSLFTERSVSPVIRHGGTIYEDYLREFQGNRGVQIYREMGNHPVVAAVLAAVKMTLRRVRWFAVAKDDKQNEAKDFLDSCMEDMNQSWSDFIDQSLSMLQYGYCPFEKVYKVRKGSNPSRPGPKVAKSKFDDNKIGWKKFAVIGQETLASGDEWIFDEKDGSLRGLNQQPPAGSYNIGTATKVAIPIEKIILFRTTVDRNNPEGRSLLRPIYESWYYSKNLTEIEAIAAERLGAGFPVFYLGEDVSKGATTGEIEEYKKMGRNIRVDEQMSLIIPHAKMGQGMAREGTGVLFELVSPASKGGIDFDVIIQRHEKRMAMVGLAQFIHLGMDKPGSQALADVTTDFFQLAVSAWADSLKDTINRFAVDQLFQLNPSLDDEEHPVLDHSDIAVPDLAVVGDYINKTVGAKVIEPDDRLEETMRRLAGFPDKDPSTVRPIMVEVDGDGGTRMDRAGRTKPVSGSNTSGNQRNQNPTAAKPRPADVPTPRKPMRASDDIDSEEFDLDILNLDELEDELKTADMFRMMELMEKFTSRKEMTRQHEDNKATHLMDQAISLIQIALNNHSPVTTTLSETRSMPPITISGDVSAETLAEAVKIMRGQDNSEADRFDAMLKAVRETPVQLVLPEGIAPDYDKFSSTIAEAVEKLAERPEQKPATVIVTTPEPKVTVLPGQINVTNEVHLPHDKTTKKSVERDDMGRIKGVKEETHYDSSSHGK